MWTSTSHRKEEVLRARLFDPHLEKQVTELPAGRVHMVRGIARDQNHVPRADGVSAGGREAVPRGLAPSPPGPVGWRRAPDTPLPRISPGASSFGLAMSPPS